MKQFFLVLATCCLFISTPANSRPGLGGGKQPRAEAYQVAKKLGLPFARTYEEITYLSYIGHLVILRDNKYFDVKHMNDGRPFVLPETKLLLERVGNYVYERCGSKIEISSGIRPSNVKVQGSVDDSVHPTGMAADVSYKDLSASCADWLEAHHLYLEDIGVVEATMYTSSSYHFHTVVYPAKLRHMLHNPYALHGALYQIRAGDTLSGIANRFNRTTTELLRLNPEIKSPNNIREKQLILID